MDIRIPIPQRWEDFEALCHRLWSEIWNDSNAQMHGRKGQAQNGIDVFGRPSYSAGYAGVQCKDKDGDLGAKLEVDELKAESAKAANFQPQIESFTLATTAPRDQAIQSSARELTESGEVPFDVQVWSWNDISGEIAYRPDILEHFYGGTAWGFVGADTIALTPTSSRSHFHAYFSRPAVRAKVPSGLSEFLLSLCYELSDNAFFHGQATDFRITAREREIVIIDNGRAFNPLEELDASKASLDGHLGSLTLDGFLKRFSDSIGIEYTREQNAGKAENQLRLHLTSDRFDLPEKDFFEVRVDYAKAFGRNYAERLVASIPIASGVREIIWNIDEMWALSFIAAIVRGIKQRLGPDQRLILYVPRDEQYSGIWKLWADERVVIRFR